MNTTPWLLALAGIMLSQQPIAARAQEPAPAGAPAAAAATGPSYLRVRDGDDGRVTLDLATRTLEPPAGGGPRIHLVGAVHIADASFYREVQKQLDGYDLVLFEGVKPPGAGAIDPAATDAERANATRGRLKFLRAMIAEEIARTGEAPATLEDAVEHSGKRWRSVVQGSLTDGWGRALRLERHQAGAGEAQAGAPGALVLISNGADGRPDPAAGEAGAEGDAAGDDLRERIALDAQPKAKDAGLQAQLAKALGLTFQLDAMDSGKPNWRSSDMSIDQVQAAMDAAGVDGSGLFSMLDGSSMMAKIGGFFLGLIAQSPTMSAMVKMTMVDVLAAAESAPGGIGAVGGMGGGRLGKQVEAMMAVILEGRNEVVVRDLRAVIAAEKDVRDVAVFYGAGHMRDLEQRLIEDLGYTPGETAWTQAISVDPRDAGMTLEQAKGMRAAMKRAIERQTGRGK